MAADFHVLYSRYQRKADIYIPSRTPGLGKRASPSSYSPLTCNLPSVFST